MHLAKGISRNPFSITNTITAYTFTSDATWGLSLEFTKVRITADSSVDEVAGIGADLKDEQCSVSGFENSDCGELPTNTRKSTTVLVAVV